MNILPEGMPPEEWAKLLDAMPAIGIPASPLVRVIAVGQSVEANDVVVDLLAVEVREVGAVLHWRALAGHDAPMLMAEVSISDDKGTSYKVLPAEGGGGAREWQGQTSMVPSPPPDATLNIVLESFGPPGFSPMPGYIPMDPVRGPWRFVVPPASA